MKTPKNIFLFIHVIRMTKKYNFYLNNTRVLIQIDNIKNHIDFTNIKYPTFSLNFRNLSEKKIGTILLIKFLEDYIKFYFQKKVFQIKPH